MIITCNKFKDLRLKKYALPQKQYSNYHVIYIIGNLTIDKDYILEDNLLTIQCEDSYIHLLKKVSLAMKIIMSLYNIKEGILKCGDDLLFDENKLIQFLENPNKSNYMGMLWGNNTYTKKYDDWMINYYNQHISELTNPLHGLINKDIYIYNRYVDIIYCIGTICYISKKACQIIIDHMELINYDIFFYNERYDAFPYFIEDNGIGFILSSNNINPISFDFNTICIHTNEFKEIT